MAITRFEIPGGRTVRKDSATGTAAISLSAGAIKASKVQSVTLNLNAAPTTSQAFTITLNANAGAAYDTLLLSLDLSAGSVTDLIWYPDEDIYIETGDSIDLAYTNTDTKTYGAQITLIEMF